MIDVWLISQLLYLLLNFIKLLLLINLSYLRLNSLWSRKNIITAKSLWPKTTVKENLVCVSEKDSLPETEYCSEAAVCRCSSKQVLLKAQAQRPATLLKRDFNKGVFLWILPNFYEQLFFLNTSGGYFWLFMEMDYSMRLGEYLKRKLRGLT